MVAADFWNIGVYSAVVGTLALIISLARTQVWKSTKDRLKARTKAKALERADIVRAIYAEHREISGSPSRMIGVVGRTICISLGGFMLLHLGLFLSIAERLGAGNKSDVMAAAGAWAAGLMVIVVSVSMSIDVIMHAANPSRDKQFIKKRLAALYTKAAVDVDDMDEYVEKQLEL